MATAQHHPGDQHEIPEYEAHASTASLKDRIKQHYEIASDYYYTLWGQHIHHGLFRIPGETKETAQVNLVHYLLEISGLTQGARVLDVGCGLGGTSRFLAREHSCAVTGITISGRQVAIAQKLTREDHHRQQQQQQAMPPRRGNSGAGEGEGSGKAETLDTLFSYVNVGGNKAGGTVRFLELDAEKMQEHFAPSGSSSFDCVWVSEALSHLPNKPLFFSSAFAVLAGGGGENPARLVIADWFKVPDLTPEQVAADIQPIEDGMLLPELCTTDDYVRMAEEAGFRTFQSPIDISAQVAKTWDISWSLVSSPSLWAFAISQGRDGLAFLQAFRAMRRGYANGTFQYAVMCFVKP